MTTNLSLLTNSDANLILTGYTGASQPAIGRALAKRLNRRLVNVEDLLEERTGLTIDELLNTYGQTRLKNVETAVLEEIVLYRGAVIRISGETLSHNDNLERLAATGPVICLVAGLDTVLRRLHMSMGARFHDPAERDLRLGKLRKEWGARGQPGVYEVDATRLNADETTEAILALWAELALQRG